MYTYCMREHNAWAFIYSSLPENSNVLVRVNCDSTLITMLKSICIQCRDHTILCVRVWIMHIHGIRYALLWCISGDPI